MCEQRCRHKASDNGCTDCQFDVCHCLQPTLGISGASLRASACIWLVLLRILCPERATAYQPGATPQETCTAIICCLKGYRIVSITMTVVASPMHSPFRAELIAHLIPRASLRCALGWYADAPSALKNPVSFLENTWITGAKNERPVHPLVGLPVQ
jgi:hypothetical protein